MLVTDDPFPHAVVEGLWNPDLLDQVFAEIPSPDDPRWTRYAGEREQKLEGSSPAMWGAATCQLLDGLRSPQWCDELGEAFGIGSLSADTIGGGYHAIPADGRLAMHVDFTRHPNGLHRRLNCLVFLNRGYRPEWGGQLLLGSDREVVIEPAFNTTAIFATSDHSWHGHPDPWQGPEPRRSVAVYYYSPEPAAESSDHSTAWLEDR